MSQIQYAAAAAKLEQEKKRLADIERIYDKKLRRGEPIDWDGDRKYARKRVDSAQKEFDEARARRIGNIDSILSVV